MMVINPTYNIGDTVYLKTDKEQLPRIVFCFKVTIKETLYELACGTTTSTHYDFELALEANILLSV